MNLVVVNESGDPCVAFFDTSFAYQSFEHFSLSLSLWNLPLTHWLISSLFVHLSLYIMYSWNGTGVKCKHRPRTIPIRSAGFVLATTMIHMLWQAHTMVYYRQMTHVDACSYLRHLLQLHGVYRSLILLHDWIEVLPHAKMITTLHQHYNRASYIHFDFVIYRLYPTIHMLVFENKPLQCDQKLQFILLLHNICCYTLHHIGCIMHANAWTNALYQKCGFKNRAADGYCTFCPTGCKWSSPMHPNMQELGSKLYKKTFSPAIMMLFRFLYYSYSLVLVYSSKWCYQP